MKNVRVLVSEEKFEGTSTLESLALLKELFDEIDDQANCVIYSSALADHTDDFANFFSKEYLQNLVDGEPVNIENGRYQVLDNLCKMESSSLDAVLMLKPSQADMDYIESHFELPAIIAAPVENLEIDSWIKQRQPLCL